MISFSFLGFISCIFTVLMFVVSTLRATVPRLPRHRHHQGDPTADSLPQHQQDQRGLRVGAPSSGGRAWERRPQGQPGAITWPEHPVAGAASRPGQRRAGAADPGAVQVPGGEPAGGGGALHEEKSIIEEWKKRSGCIWCSITLQSHNMMLFSQFKSTLLLRISRFSQSVLISARW